MAGQTGWQSNPIGKMPMDCYRGAKSFPGNHCQVLNSNFFFKQDQWGQFTTHDVSNQLYERPLSTVFVDASGQSYDEDRDPILGTLHFLDYRYLRFFYHPIEDKYSLISGWKDPAWTTAKAMRAGLDADERDSREQIFGQNNINIQHKTVPQLLVDEVWIALNVVNRHSD